MKKTTSLFRQQIAAHTGKLILSLYNLYTTHFVKKDDLEFLHPPVQHREIILIRKTHQGYRAMADVVALN